MMMKSLMRCFLVVALLMAVLSGCGYTMQKAPMAVKIGPVENMTGEAGLEDRLTEALVSSLMRNGIRVDGSSGNVIKGNLRSLALDVLSEETEISTTYRVTIKGEFSLKVPDGADKKLPGGGRFIVTFSSRGDLTSVIADKELAIKQALGDMAEEISAALLYMR
jgi:outer membrane lipopolysaccharide assembly protein LptE/RlpB